jgi:hypothetical protein
MKITKILLPLVVLFSVAAHAENKRATFTVSTPKEDWKGPPSDAEFTFGAMAGLGMVDPDAGLGLLLNGAKKIYHQGFVPDINNQVFLELTLGPVFAANHVPFVYGIHLRWDFQKDEQWTFYGFGGLGGNIARSTTGGSRFLLFPQFGGGAFYHFDSRFSARGEVSHEWTTLGISCAI